MMIAPNHSSFRRREANKNKGGKTRNASQGRKRGSPTTKRDSTGSREERGGTAHTGLEPLTESNPNLEVFFLKPRNGPPPHLRGPPSNLRLSGSESGVGPTHRSAAEDISNISGAPSLLRYPNHKPFEGVKYKRE